nr:hypothetical protein L203_02839 [Cryptococcus depauperatus CBS 7841]
MSKDVDANRGAGLFKTPTEDAQTTENGVVEMMDIPSTGLEFFEYRRRLFLAGFPIPTTPTTQTLPEKYKVPKQPPDPLPVSVRRDLHPSILRIDRALSEEGAIGSKELWESGVRDLACKLHNGRKFTKGMRLGLVASIPEWLDLLKRLADEGIITKIKILISSWISEGLWPLDPITNAPEQPPASPIIKGVDLFPELQGQQPSNAT